jgi:hypothetical protein
MAEELRVSGEENVYWRTEIRKAVLVKQKRIS